MPEIESLILGAIYSRLICDKKKEMGNCCPTSDEQQVLNTNQAQSSFTGEVRRRSLSFLSASSRVLHLQTQSVVFFRDAGWGQVMNRNINKLHSPPLRPLTMIYPSQITIQS
jgi:hypothetical protein